MNIVVCVKHVPDAAGDRRFRDDFTVDRAGVDGVLSELDEYAVEQALRIKEARAAGEVTVIALTVGPEKAADAIRKSLQMGADEGVHILDDAIAGSDAAATSLVLGAAVGAIAADGVPAADGATDRGPVDMVICGMASTDASMSVVPAMLAERLGWPQLTFAAVVETQGAEVRIRRDGDSATQVVGATMPVVVSVTDQSGEVRYPSFKGIMAAKKKPVATLSLADLGLAPHQTGAAAAWTAVVDVSQRPPRSAGEVVVDSDGSGAAALTEFLAARKFV
ncbi:MAG: electron transfer flavoprotein subunit beta/FixA family protein [Nocardioides sp.]